LQFLSSSFFRSIDLFPSFPTASFSSRLFIYSSLNSTPTTTGRTTTRTRTVPSVRSLVFSPVFPFIPPSLAPPSFPLRLYSLIYLSTDHNDGNGSASYTKSDGSGWTSKK
jgi:hypothetical protein